MQFAARVKQLSRGGTGFSASKRTSASSGPSWAAVKACVRPIFDPPLAREPRGFMHVAVERHARLPLLDEPPHRDAPDVLVERNSIHGLRPSRSARSSGVW